MSPEPKNLNDFRIAFSAQSKDGYELEIKSSDFNLIMNTGNEICLDFTPIDKSNISVGIGLAVDVSGSMSKYVTDLQESLNSFFQNTPPQAQCEIVEFSDSWKNIWRGECPRADEYQVSKTGSGTKAFFALSEVYKNIKKEKYDIPIVIILSDGKSDEDNFEKAMVEKGDVKTFVNWLGDYDKSKILKEFADEQYAGVVSYYGSFNGFLAGLNGLLSSQMVANSCVK